MRRTMMTVLVETHEDGEPVVPERWTVTCERCGADLSDDYGTHPLTVITIDKQSPPEFQRQVAERLAAIRTAGDWQKRPLIVTSDVSFEQFGSHDLQRMIGDHHKTCDGKRGG